ncbi:hypothetical protein PAMP_023898 [Pampus punctatissimus]
MELWPAQGQPDCHRRSHPASARRKQDYQCELYHSQRSRGHRGYPGAPFFAAGTCPPGLRSQRDNPLRSPASTQTTSLRGKTVSRVCMCCIQVKGEIFNLRARH